MKLAENAYTHSTNNVNERILSSFQIKIIKNVFTALKGSQFKFLFVIKRPLISIMVFKKEDRADVTTNT